MLIENRERARNMYRRYKKPQTPKLRRAPRKCLRCGRVFNSEGPWNRICHICSCGQVRIVIQTAWIDIEPELDSTEWPEMQ